MVKELELKFGEDSFRQEKTADDIVTIHIKGNQAQEVLTYLKTGIDNPFSMLYDLTAIDERNRQHAKGSGDVSFSVVYHLTSFDRNQDLRVKVDLKEEFPSLPSITSLWPMASWYEREVYDMFGIKFTGHPHLRRILMPQSWEGHPLRKGASCPGPPKWIHSSTPMTI